MKIILTRPVGIFGTFLVGDSRENDRTKFFNLMSSEYMYVEAFNITVQTILMSSVKCDEKMSLT